MLPLLLRHGHCRHQYYYRLFLRLRHTHHFSTFHPQPFEIPLSHPTYLVWSANTSLGKTLVSTGLASSFLLSSSSTSSAKRFLYLKPTQTGFPRDSDSRFLFNKLSSLSLRRQLNFSLFLSNSVLTSSLSAAKSLLLSKSLQLQPERCSSGMYDLNFCEEKKIFGEKNVVSESICKTLFAWEEAVSPHLAAERESGVLGDSEVVEMLGKCLRDGLESKDERMEILCVVETAGGVASPGPSGSLQCDLYRPFRLPCILVGDGQLGGISGTISAYESLKLRGYDIVAIVFEDHGLVNEVPLMSYLRNRVPVLVLPSLPQDPSNDLMEWFDESWDVFNSLKSIMLSTYSERIDRLTDMPKKAGELFWWPFTQHGLVPEETVTVIDSRCGENFSVYQVRNQKSISQQFDACASWWTQGPDATLQIELARDMGYTAARFGHVMFPENVYEPALECAELLRQGVGKGWASRTYFSDNGSTAIEIALKMAFRKFSFDHEILPDFLKNYPAKKCIELKVLALKGSYHGDTLGAMEAQAPSPYTGFLQQPWYSGRGIFLDPPTVFMCNNIWNLSLPEWLHSENVELEDISFSSRDGIFDKIRDCSDLALIYTSYISQKLLQNSGLTRSFHIGALIMEPVIHAAGGMHMVDPLFQRILVKECRNRKIPVIFDEVFTGFWRLGVETTADLLGCVPDIACFGKLFTGGVIPLSATLTTESIFDSFVGDSKLKALLHGHSYSAHALGCAAATKSMKWFKDPQTNLNIIPGRRMLRELWDLELVQRISSHRTIRRVVALGTVCALELRTEGRNAGYGSLYAAPLLQKLREDGIFMRPLGNVIYLMCGPCTSPEVCKQLLIKLYERLEEFNEVEGPLKSC